MGESLSWKDEYLIKNSALKHSEWLLAERIAQYQKIIFDLSLLYRLINPILRFISASAG